MNELLNPVFWENKKQYHQFAEFAQRVVKGKEERSDRWLYLTEILLCWLNSNHNFIFQAE